MVIEIRQVSLSQTCQGNWRVRLTQEGVVYAARNQASCPPGQAWSTPWPGEPVARLSAVSTWWLWRKIPVDNLFRLPGHVSDPARATMGGYQTEVHLEDGARQHDVIVENTTEPSVEAVRKALQGFVPRG